MAGTGANGVYLQNGGTVSNASSGTITGGLFGARVLGGAGTVTNQGTITGAADEGTRLQQGGSVANTGTAARITGGGIGVYVNGGAGVVTNQGTITGTSTNGIDLIAGGTVTNSGTASLITGKAWGIYDPSNLAMTIADQGTITGGTAGGAIHFGNASGNLLQLAPGAVLNGIVQGGTGSATNTLELQSGLWPGPPWRVNQIRGFQSVYVDHDAHWAISGALTLAAAATIGKAGGATLKVAGSLEAPGNLTVTGYGAIGAGGGGGSRWGPRVSRWPARSWSTPGTRWSTVACWRRRSC